MCTPYESYRRVGSSIIRDDDRGSHSQPGSFRINTSASTNNQALFFCGNDLEIASPTRVIIIVRVTSRKSLKASPKIVSENLETISYMSGLLARNCWKR